MVKRFILMLVVVLALVAGLGFVKYRQIQAAIAQGASFAPPPSAVTTVVTQRDSWPSTMDVIVELDTREERAQLAAAESDRDLAKINYGREQQLVNEGVIPRSEYDNAAAQQKSTEAKVGEIKATIERKTIRAPFSGVLGIRQINLGQYLAAGQAIVPLQSVHPIYVNFGVPQQSAPQMRPGGTLRVTSDDLRGVEFT